jgi:starch-binding outer membrane protein, SusD/RagB family
MKATYKILLTLLITGSLFTACKDQLDIKNPNNPTPASASNESGIIGLAQGSVYVNGFNSLGNKFYDGVIGAFFNGVYGIHDMMGDQIAAEAANAYMNQISCPNDVTLDDGSKVVNPNSPNTFIPFIRSVNVNANQGQNPGFHEWAFMYGLNNSCNNILELVDKTSFSGDAAAKKNTIKAWAYFWKGFAYSRIGSMYYAGIINNAAGATNGNYVTKEKIIEESNANLDKAVSILGSVSASSDYSDVLGKLIPDFCQTGKGGILTAAQWIRNINTPVATMTPAQWGTLLTLTNAGITASDKVFTGRANANGDIFTASGYNVAARCVGANASGGTFKVSERLIQDFNTGDQRLANNFNKFTTWIGNADRGNSFNTRWALKDGGNGISGVMVYANRTPLAGEMYLVGSYEENELMKAEAKLYTGDVSGAATSINSVRTTQGAGLPALSSSDLATVKEELRKERRVSLAFRGLSFYDARRWNIITDGRKNAVVISKTGVISTKATINYGYLDYWDVPDNELAYNPAATGSATIKNPK